MANHPASCTRIRPARWKVLNTNSGTPSRGARAFNLLQGTRFIPRHCAAVLFVEDDRSAALVEFRGTHVIRSPRSRTQRAGRAVAGEHPARGSLAPLSEGHRHPRPGLPESGAAMSGPGLDTPRGLPAARGGRARTTVVITQWGGTSALTGRAGTAAVSEPPRADISGSSEKRLNRSIATIRGRRAPGRGLPGPAEGLRAHRVQRLDSARCLLAPGGVVVRGLLPLRRGARVRMARGALGTGSLKLSPRPCELQPDGRRRTRLSRAWERRTGRISLNRTFP